MDELERVTGGLLTEATVHERVTAVRTYTRGTTVLRAKRLLARITPYPEWVRSRPRSAEAREMYKRLLKELGAIIAGHRPDEITVSIGKDESGAS
jgi:hypothetical protein